MKKKLFSIFFIIVAIFLLAACDDGKYKVTFDFDDGRDPVVFMVDEGETVDELTDVVREGFEFIEWQLDGDKYVFSTPVVKDITLIALWEEVPNIETVRVKFNSDGGTLVEDQVLESGEKATKPNNPTRDYAVFLGWQLDGVDYDFNQEVTKNITLKAVWDVDFDQMILDDYNFLKDNFFVNANKVNFPSRGEIAKSFITWVYPTEHINSSGFILPLKEGEAAKEVEVTAKIRQGEVTKDYIFIVHLSSLGPVLITSERELEFNNLTTEYDVSDMLVSLYFEEDGNVPYIKLVDFFALLDGFIDPEYDITFTKGEDELEIKYDYYDEEEDHTYNLVNTLNVSSNTITTNDPGFYWAYVKSTETNYGRHIFYDRENLDASYIEGDDLVFNLNDYSIRLGMHEGELIVPYFLANQLYAGSSYYNVYYNGDGLFGIYMLPSSSSDEYKRIKDSEANNAEIPADLAIHNYNMLAFNLDYFYGLKEELGVVETFYELLSPKKNQLITSFAKTFDGALSDFILKVIDEPHTSYGYPSYYNDKGWEGPKVTSLMQFGTRMNKFYNDGLYAIDDLIEAKWGRKGITSQQWAAESDNRPDYWFLDDLHAVISLDSFSTADIEESTVYNKNILENYLKIADASFIPAIAGGNKFFYYKNDDVDNLFTEVLVKGISKTYLNTYKNELLSKGFTHVVEDTTKANKKAGYYQIKLDGTMYYVQVAYSDEYDLFYLGITDKEFPEAYSDEWPLEVDIKALVEEDSAVYMELTLENLFFEKPAVTSITLDLTWNMGGNVGALYRVLGFITSDPFKVTNISKGTSSASTSYVYIDGVPSYDHLEWSLLTSPVTFSAANSMTTIFKENNLGKVIGVTTGGGACSITPILLPIGTAFTMSSNSQSGYRLGTGVEGDEYTYHNVEFGVTPDVVIAKNALLSASAILDALNG